MDYSQVEKESYPISKEGCVSGTAQFCWEFYGPFVNQRQLEICASDKLSHCHEWFGVMLSDKCMRMKE